MTRSVISPKRFSGPQDKGLLGGLKPLFTPGAKGAAILTGKYGYAVFEYPTTADAGKALERANRSDAIKRETDKPPKLLNKTLVIEYEGGAIEEPIIRACALHPDQPAPPPS
jgi:hypothetical protein